MLIELSKSDHIWFSDFLTEYLRLKKTHVLNGAKISEKTLERLYNMTQITPMKGGSCLIPIEPEDVGLLEELLEECVMACPGCTLGSLRHRKSVANKVLRLIDDVEIGDV